MSQIDLFDEIIVDNFAGGGGASTGIELAAGRPVAIAINHDPDAILLHKTNHPYTEHMQASVWDVDPVEVCRGRPVGLAWFSPDCKHFSKAKGAALVDRNIRGLAWIVLRWAGTVRPRVIMLENVEEFQTWGPVRKGKPVKSKAGQTFRRWKQQLQDLGYEIEHRELVAADYGAPTTRKRFVLVARCDGKPIVWPERTHAPRDSEEVKSGKCQPWRGAHEIIDWSQPSYSIFASKAEIKEKYGVNAVRPLADNTLRRVIRGVDKFTIKSGKPFLVPMGYGERKGQQPRVHDIDAPLPTVVGKDKHGLCSCHMVKFKGQELGTSPTDPLPTITTQSGGGGFAECRAVLVKANCRDNLGYWPQIRELLNKHCGYNLADDEVILLIIGGVAYFIADILLRMLNPREQYDAMSFPRDYAIEYDYLGNKYPKNQQTAKCGNAVCPVISYAMVWANFPEWRGARLKTMAELDAAVAV